MHSAVPIYKSRKTARFIVMSIAAFAIAVLPSCELDLFNGGIAPDEGSLRVSIDRPQQSLRYTLLPNTDMDPDEYVIRGSGPADESFEESTSGESVEIHGLRAGEWDIEVSALNGEGAEIGFGMERTTVESEEMTGVTVVVQALAGTGALSLSVTWPDEEVLEPRLEAALATTDGEQSEIDFDLVEDGQAEYANDEIEAGYYTFSVQLFDGEHEVAGAVEAVRIVRDGLTEGSFVFDDLNVPSGDVDIIISPDLDEPLEVTIEGGESSLAYGESMTVSATVANGDDADIEYSWYLNGSLVGSESSLTLGEELAAGSYRLDVVANTTDGTRSGSATHSFTVE